MQTAHSCTHIDYDPTPAIVVIVHLSFYQQTVNFARSLWEDCDATQLDPKQHCKHSPPAELRWQPQRTSAHNHESSHSLTSTHTLYRCWIYRRLDLENTHTLTRTPAGVLAPLWHSGRHKDNTKCVFKVCRQKLCDSAAHGIRRVGIEWDKQ